MQVQTAANKNKTPAPWKIRCFLLLGGIKFVHPALHITKKNATKLMTAENTKKANRVIKIGVIKGN